MTFIIPKNMKSIPARAAVALALAGGWVAAGSVGGQAMAQSAPSATPAIERGLTKPKQEPKLVFYAPGVVAKLMVEEGQRVQAGDVLAIQNDAEEQAKLLSLQGELISADLQIDAAKADLKQKVVALKRKLELYAELVALGKSNTEIEEAQVAVEVGEIAVKYRVQERVQKGFEIKAQQIKLQLKKLISPVAGIVAKIDVKVGEGSDLTKPAIMIVQNDTLYVEVDVPSTRAKTLHIGDTLQVSYPDEKDAWMAAKVTFLTPYASASSGTRKVRMEMDNTAKREAGLAVYVKLPDNAAAPAAPAAAAAR
jgi:RND family efflux transporter MFP subunit